MASAQVLPNSASSSRKQNLEAGKRLLEEFRKKKKAEGRAKKPALTGQQQQSTDVSEYVTQISEIGSKRPAELDEPATSEIDEPLQVVTTSDNKAIDSSSTIDLGSSSGTQASSHLSDGGHNSYSIDPAQEFVKDFTSKQYQGSELYLNYDRLEVDKNPYPSAYNGTQEIQTNIINQHIPRNRFHGIGYNDGNLYQSSNYSISEAQLKEDESHLNEDYGTSHASVTSISSMKQSDAVHHDTGFASTSASGIASAVLNEVGYSVNSIPSTTSLAESFPRAEQSNGSMDFIVAQMKHSSSINQELSTDGAPWKSSESLSSGYTSDFRSSSNHIPLSSEIYETSIQRNRSSFLDSLNVPRVSAFSRSSFTQPEKTETFMSRSSKIHSADTLASSASRQSFTNNMSVGSFDKLRSQNVPDMNDQRNNSVSVSTEEEIQNHEVPTAKWNHEVPTAKQDENFAALEQYIEELTQEKFSLKRDLEASRALAESLATENSSLTDSYNQQRALVNQLKSDMESLQEEIKAQLLELDSVRMEYTNAKLECNAADERANILASEVIGLEEKALKLRSTELKLERQLENSSTEITSYKKKVSSLQKERQDLQFTIDALQEEKKLLQSKLRKAAGNVKSVEVIKTPSVGKNVSTSTDDLGFEDSDLVRDMNRAGVNTVQSTLNHVMHNGALISSDTISTFQLSPENRQLHFAVVSAAIPPDQLRMIGNINSLISELALEKEELVRALSSESSHSSKLKELNKELSRKLEAQTQRLELLTAQSMANENILGRPTDSHQVHESIAYTDEGDEVVERVLGWIMKLFPGGPSKRRTRRLL